jgi:hypothetical protein
MSQLSLIHNGGQFEQAPPRQAAFGFRPGCEQRFEGRAQGGAIGPDRLAEPCLPGRFLQSGSQENATLKGGPQAFQARSIQRQGRVQTRQISFETFAQAVQLGQMGATAMFEVLSAHGSLELGGTAIPFSV